MALVITIVVGLAGVAGLVILEVVNMYQEPVVKGAVLHTGATEGFEKELKRMKTAPFSRELERVLTEAELIKRDWDQFHDNMIEPLARFGANINAALDVFLRDMPAVRMEIA